MKTLYFSINPNHQNLILGNLFQFLFVTFLALFIGYALYYLLSATHARKKSFKLCKTIPRKWAFFIGGFTGLLIIGFTYIDNWSYFFQIDIKKNNFHLHYFLPERTVTIATEQIKELISKEAWHKTRNYRLVLKTKDGKEYKSSLIDSTLFQNNMNELHRHVKRKE